jgi:hypothetical protein
MIMQILNTQERFEHEVVISLLTQIMLLLYSSVAAIFLVFAFLSGPATYRRLGEAAVAMAKVIIANLPLILVVYGGCRVLHWLVSLLLWPLTWLLFFIAPAFVFFLLSIALLPLEVALYSHLWVVLRRAQDERERRTAGEIGRK